MVGLDAAKGQVRQLVNLTRFTEFEVSLDLEIVRLNRTPAGSVLLTYQLPPA